MSDDNVEVNDLMVAIIQLKPNSVQSLIANNQIHDYKNEIGPFGNTPYKHISLTEKWLNKLRTMRDTNEINESYENAKRIRELLDSVPGIDKQTGRDPRTGEFEYERRLDRPDRSTVGKSNNKNKKRRITKKRKMSNKRRAQSKRRISK